MLHMISDIEINRNRRFPFQGTCASGPFSSASDSAAVKISSETFSSKVPAKIDSQLSSGILCASVRYNTVRKAMNAEHMVLGISVH